MRPFTLPSGATAILRDATEVTERARRPITRASGRLASGSVGELLALHERQGMDDAAFEDAAAKLIGTDDWAVLDEISDLLIVALVASWSYDFPVTLDGVLDLPGPDYQALKAETAKYQTALLPDFSPTPEPESPTVP